MDATTLSGKVAVVTGGTGGIGLHTAIGLARLGARVVVTGRDRERGEAGVAEITAASGSAAVELALADLSSQSEVRRLAAELAERHPRLDVLVNNVGGLYTTRWETADGIEASLAVNALNPLLLTTLLLPALRAAAPARVVYLTGGRPGGLRLDDLQGRQRYLGIDTYSHAKTVMMALAREQADRLDPALVTVNVVYPGGASTAMTQAMTPATMPAPMRPLFPLFRATQRLLRTEWASRSSVGLASAPEFAGVTGRYFSTRSRPKAWPRDVGDPRLRRRAWDAAADLLGLPADGPARGAPVP